jgi:hypothetical protein
LDRIDYCYTEQFSQYQLKDTTLGHAITVKKTDKSFTRFSSSISTHQRVSTATVFTVACQELHKIQISVSTVNFGILFRALSDTNKR